MITTVRRLASACAAKSLLLAFAALSLAGPAQAGTDFILANVMDAFGVGPCALTEAMALLQDRLASADS